MDTPSLPKRLEEMRDYVRRDVAAGFLSTDAIAENASEMYAEEQDPEELLPHAERMARELAAAHWKEQETWPVVTDSDRLDAAFDELEREGIVCRQNFSCCGTCGQVEIGDEIRQAEANGRAVRGYSFYHFQDTDAAVEGHGLYLNYGGMEEGDAATTRIGQEVARVLARHGLTVCWNGRPETRIYVKMDWKRRRPLTVPA
jgi:hypothetical protein